MRCPRLTLTTLLAASPLALTLGATAHAAGVYVENIEKELDGSKAPVTSKMWFDGGRMRIERADPDGQNLVIFKDQAMYTVDSKSKTYNVIDRSAAEKMAAQVAAAKKQMEARMAAMPPEQRKKMEEMMAKLGHGGAAGMLPNAPKRSLKNTGRTETVAGIKCTIWEVSVGGQKEEELCSAPAGAVPNGEEVIKTFRDIGTMLKSFTDSLGGSQENQPWQDMETINGVPILTREFSEGKATSETRLSAVRKESAAANLFEVPPGYTQRKMNFGKPAGGDAD
jgi:hypothetical protein